MKLLQIQATCKNKRIAGSLFFLSFFLILVQTGCKKLIEAPPNSISIEKNSVFSTDATAAAVLVGIYNSLNHEVKLIQGGGGVALITGLSSDELTLFNNSASAASYYFGNYNNVLSVANPPIPGVDFWSPFYNLIFKCNAAIDGLNASESLTPLVKQQLLGEAEFLRAFFYFYLTNMYGDVPLALGTDPEVNTQLSKSSSSDVYQQIIADLQDAKSKLSADYLDVTLLNTTTERVRPTKWAAAALLARVYLYQASLGDNTAWAKAEAEASTVINNSSLYNLTTSLNSVFLKNSGEAIWQLQPTEKGFNTKEGNIFIIPPTGPSVDYNPVYLSDQLFNSFEPNDQRAVFGNWLDTTIYNPSSTTYDTVVFPYKYKVSIAPGVTSADGISEYLMMLRVGEQYLIRAEARAHQNKMSEAKADIDAIRERAGLPGTTANDQNSLYDAILHERQTELFCEAGHRWFDLKRTGKIDAVMNIITPIKSNGTNTWHSHQQLYPLQLSELQSAPNVVQNPGYN